MKFIHKVEVRLVNDYNNNKSTILSSRIISSELASDAPTAEELCESVYTRLVEDKDVDTAKYDKLKEEVTKPSKRGVLLNEDKLFGEGFGDSGKIIVYTVYLKNKVVAPLTGNDAYLAAKKAALAPNP